MIDFDAGEMKATKIHSNNERKTIKRDSIDNRQPSYSWISISEGDGRRLTECQNVVGGAEMQTDLITEVVQSIILNMSTICTEIKTSSQTGNKIK